MQMSVTVNLRLPVYTHLANLTHRTFELKNRLRVPFGTVFVR